MATTLIRKKVIHLGGYDPMEPEAFFARFNRELGRSAGCWAVAGSTRDFHVEADRATWTSELRGPGWIVLTTHELVRWDDVIKAHRARSTWSRWLGGIVSFLDFVAHGTVWRYLTTAWRYAAFFIYPFALLVAAFALVKIAVVTVFTALGVGGPVSMLISLAAALIASFLLVRRGHIGHLLDDWDFARRLIRHADPVISTRLKLASDRLGTIPPEIDVLVVGHSLGAVLAAELLDETIARHNAARSYTFVALGSSILKLALHGKAARLRQQLGRINRSGVVRWTDYQSLSDVMNFYKSDPVKVLNLEGPSPLVRQVRFSRMLKPDYYRKIKTNFFRLHCQFISGNDMRAPYDYILMTCGPFSVEALARSPDGAMGWLDETGALTVPGRAAITRELEPERDPPP
jgi:hypothetical protein